MAKIFIVDDDQNLAFETRMVLVREGYEVEVFYEGHQAIEEAKRHRPDLILMDLLMPRFNGAEAIKELKKDNNLAHVPIIIITGLLSVEEYLDMTRMAVDGKTYKTLCKPYEIKELTKAVKDSLRWMPA